MTDCELLEAAAKAAGIPCKGWCMPGARSDGWSGMYTYSGSEDDGAYVRWNPLTDDGDALRLAVKLGIGVLSDLQDVKVTAYQQEPHSGFFVEFADDQEPSAATRRAIVRAAAEIGRAMP